MVAGNFGQTLQRLFYPDDIWRSPERSFQYRENSQKKNPLFSCNGRFVGRVFVDLFWHPKNILLYFQCISKITRLKMSDCQIFTLPFKILQKLFQNKKFPRLRNAKLFDFYYFIIFQNKKRDFKKSLNLK